ncbi:polymorphic toxin type 15 domain-containing protein, partial [Listeria seeligeri]
MLRVGDDLLGGGKLAIKNAGKEFQGTIDNGIQAGKQVLDVRIANVKKVTDDAMQAAKEKLTRDLNDIGTAAKTIQSKAKETFQMPPRERLAFAGVGDDIAGQTATGTISAAQKKLRDMMSKMDDLNIKGSGNDDIIKKASGTVDDIPKISEVEVKFKRNANHDSEEFTRQLKKQQDGMNQLTVDEYLKNRQQYLDKGRVPEASVAQQTARQEALADKILELRNQGIPRTEAKSQAEDWMKKQAALHDPDMIAGGNPTNIQGLGDSKINSSLGSQWRTRISEVDRQIQEAAKNMSPEQLKNTRINIKFTE